MGSTLRPPPAGPRGRRSGPSAPGRTPREGGSEVPGRMAGQGESVLSRPPPRPDRRARSREGDPPDHLHRRTASSALGGPDWLVRRRAEAWQRFAASSFPTEAEEVWRYSGIDAFDLGAFGPVSPEAAGDRSGQALAVARRLADSLGPRAGLVVTRNGMVDVIEVAPPGLPDALVVSGVSPRPVSRLRPGSPGHAGSRPRTRSGSCTTPSWPTWCTSAWPAKPSCPTPSSWCT